MYTDTLSGETTWSVYFLSPVQVSQLNGNQLCTCAVLCVYTQLIYRLYYRYQVLRRISYLPAWSVWMVTSVWRLQNTSVSFVRITIFLVNIWAHLFLALLTYQGSQSWLCSLSSVPVNKTKYANNVAGNYMKSFFHFLGAKIAFFRVQYV